MSKIQQFEDLEIWKMARALCKVIYSMTIKPNFSQDFKLKGQILGSSGSVMDNIAEGFERGGNKEFIQFLFIAKGSAGETRSQLYRALDQHFISQEEFDETYKESILLSKKISSFINYLKKSNLKGTKYHDKP